ncbi:MAG: ABC transporter permease [Candidatus Limnocylindrales bacterium]|jgi:simple sugar transport system permease protein
MKATQPYSRRVVSRLLTIGQSNEFVLVLVIVVLCLLVGLAERNFWNLGTAFDIARNSLETVVFALAFLVVLLVGGIDVSFDAIGIFSGYTAAWIAVSGYYDSDIILAFVLAGLIGLGLGAVNAVIVDRLRLPVLIATLATRSVFVGVLLTYIGAFWYNFLPGQLGDFHYWQVIRVPVGRGSTSLHPLVIPVLVLAVVLWLVLSRTMFGRGLYAVGGDAEAARRAGFPVRRLVFMALCLAGLLAGLGGMVHVSLGGNADPYELVGSELTPIAAVVLGGASIFGGKGTVLGTVLGAVLISLINYSMVSLGVPAAWTQVIVGLFILIAIASQLMRGRRRARSLLAIPSGA